MKITAIFIIFTFILIGCKSEGELVIEKEVLNMEKINLTNITIIDI